VDDVDVIEWDAELVGHQLGEGRLVTLTVAVGAGEHRYRAGRMDAHGRGFVQSGAGPELTDEGRGSDAAALDVGAKADAA
jgi:hypothetical protein